MFRKFTARNFRCFKDFEIKPLARINLIVGGNNAGKTALLEALFLHCVPSTPENFFAVNLLRGATGNNADLWKELEWLFYVKQTAEEIELKSVHDRAGESTLHIFLAHPEQLSLFPVEPNGSLQTEMQVSTTIARPKEFILKYTDQKGDEFSSRARLTPLESRSSSTNIDPMDIKFSSLNIDPFGRALFVLRHPRFPEAYAELYSALVESGREADLLLPLRALDPRIHRLELLFRARLPLFHVGIDDVPDMLMPLQYMGEGIAHVLSQILVIKTTENGTVLIDEFENGLHYGALVDVWKAVGAAARQSNVQIFATTHSRECVKAAYQAFAECDEDDFRLHRLERRDGEVVALTYDQEQLDTAIEFNFEVR